MRTDESRFEAERILRTLRVNASEFGYRAQALFAETLARMGAVIDEVARVGHPDVMARIRGRGIRIQVKYTGQCSFTLDADDLEGIRPRSEQEDGYLAVLDLGPPVAWTCVPHSRARELVGRSVPLAMLKAMDDTLFSSECTDVFVELVIEHRTSIDAFTFSLVRRRALADGRVER